MYREKNRIESSPVTGNRKPPFSQAKVVVPQVEEYHPAQTFTRKMAQESNLSFLSVQSLDISGGGNDAIVLVTRS